MYGAGVKTAPGKSENPLDQWILARLAEITREMSQSFDAYELDRAVKPVALFIDDLSTWYIRRSRDRFKSDDTADRAHAIETTRTVLLELSKLLAPVMPFLAEHLYGRVGGEKESVHLEAWPVATEPNTQILKAMFGVRNIVSLALEARAKAGIKVRQPLALVTVRGDALDDTLALIIADELNVKKVKWSNELTAEIEIDTVITPELKREGQFRELLRAVQGLRKESNLEPSDIITLRIKTTDEGKALVSEFTNELKKTALVKEIVFKDVLGEPTDIDGTSFTLALISDVERAK